MKKIETKELFLAAGVLSVVALVLVLIVFTLNTQREGAGVARGVGIIGVAAEQENATENETTYFDAGHDYVYEVRGGEVSAVVARAPAAYPFAFACGAFVKNGSSVNNPLIQGDVLFQQYPRGNSYPTWNRVTGEYREIVSLDELDLDVASAAPASINDAATAISVQKESCVDMTAGASIVAIGSFIIFGVLSFMSSRRPRKA